MIINILELKDSYTKKHSERVAMYATILAKETNQYNQKTLIRVYYSCLLHDIGKIGIPNEILNKTSTLTEKEYDVIKTHPKIGIQLIKMLSLIDVDYSIIRSHHERWDGVGYPDGLQGKEIPLSARIVSIADAFDAMTSTRTYRKALSSEEAYNRIIEGKGTQFDPELINHFKKIFSSWAEMNNQFINIK